MITIASGKQEAADISIKISDPVWYANRADYPHLSDGMLHTGHEIAALGGFKSATAQKVCDVAEAEDWLELLGYDFVAYNPYTNEIFSGFINNIRASLGTLSIERGPLLDAANRVSVIYSPTMPSGTASTEQSTIIVQDTVLQARYGIIERILSGGQVNTAEAEELRDLFLAEMKHPITKVSPNMGGASSVPGVQLDIAGYYEWLKVYPYISVGTTIITITDKLLAVLAANPNPSTISTDYRDVYDNAALISAYDNDNRMAASVAEELLGYGDYAANRTLFGVYEGRRVKYNTIPSAIQFEHIHVENDHRIVDYSGHNDVPFYNIRPGKWLFVPDFKIGSVQPSTLIDLKSDVRAVFIESVNYSTQADTITIEGSKVGRLYQRLAQLGVGGL